MVFIVSVDLDYDDNWNIRIEFCRKLKIILSIQRTSSQLIDDNLIECDSKFYFSTGNGALIFVGHRS